MAYSLLTLKKGILCYAEGIQMIYPKLNTINDWAPYVKGQS